MNKFKTKIPHWFWIILFISISLVIIWFKDGLIKGGGESGLPFYNLGIQLNINKDTWAPPALGNALGINIASLTTYWSLYQLENLGIPNVLLEAFLFLLVLLMSGVAIFLLTKELFQTFNSKMGFIAVFFYWFNPFSLVNVWNRFLYNYMVFYALLPLATYFYLRGIKEKRYVYAYIIGLLTGIFSYALTSVPFNILLWSVFGYVTIFYLVFEKGKSGRLFDIFFFFLTLTSFTVVNFWWVSQLFSFVSSSYFTTSVNNFFTAAGNLAGLTTLSEELGQLTNTLRLMHGTFFDQGPTWSSIYNFPALVLLEFATTAIILWTVFKHRKTQSVLLLGGLLFITLFLIKGNQPPFGELFQYIFLKSSTFQVFRNPFEKFGFLLPLAAAPLFAYGVGKIAQYFTKKSHKSIFIIGAFAFVVIILGFPFWTGLVFTSNFGVNNSLESYDVKVPSYYSVVNNWFQEQGNDYRFISLPLGGEGMTYTWTKPYSGVELSATLFSTPNISFNTTIPYYSNLVSSLSTYQLNDNLLNFTPFTNVKYIMLRKDIDYQAREMANPNTSKNELESLISKGLISKQFNEGALTIYQINPDYFWPKIFTTSEFFSSNGSDLSKLSRFDSEFPKQKMAVINYSTIPISNQITSNVVIEPEKVFTPPLLYNFQNLTDQELMAKLFYVSTLPTNKFYPFVRFKELIQAPPQSDYSAWIVYKTGILGKRAVEIFDLIKNNSPRSAISAAEKNYDQSLTDLTSNLNGVVRGNSDVSEVLRDSLLYQGVLLKRVSSDSFAFLDNFLTQGDLKPKFNLPDSGDKTYVVYSFEVPVAGNYLVNLDETNPTASLFLDGKVSSTSAILSSGTHEVATSIDTSLLAKPLLELDPFFSSNASRSQWNINIPNSATTYKISFDYQFSQGTGFNFSFAQDIDAVNNPIYHTQIMKDKYINGWKHWEGQFNTLVGAANGKLSLSPIAVPECRGIFLWRSCIASDQPYKVELKNFKLEQLNNYPSVSLSSFKSLEVNSQTTSQFTQVGATKYQVQIAKDNPKPEMLVFSELFNSGWKATYSDGTPISPSNHFLVNDYANGWILTKQGKYTITIEFAPQKLLDVGKIISIVSAVLVILCSGLSLMRRRFK